MMERYGVSHGEMIIDHYEMRYLSFEEVCEKLNKYEHMNSFLKDFAKKIQKEDM